MSLSQQLGFHKNEVKAIIIRIYKQCEVSFSEYARRYRKKSNLEDDDLPRVPPFNSNRSVNNDRENER